MAIKYNPLDPFGTKSLFDDINKTNQQINSMNLPMQPTQPKQDFKKQRYGNMMLALSDVLRGQNPSAGVMQRQALIDAEQKEAERKAAFKDIINNSTLIPDSMKGLAEVFPEPFIKSILSRSGTDRKMIKGADGFNYYADGTRVLPNVVANTETSKRKTIQGADGFNYFVDTGKRVLPNVVKDETESDRKYEKAGDGFYRYIDDGTKVFGDVEIPEKGLEIKTTDVLSTQKDEKRTFDATNKGVKNFQQLLDAAQAADGAASYALMIKFIKQLDDSVVREGEVNTFGGFQGALTNLKNQISKTSGDGFTPTVKANMINLAGQTANRLVNDYNLYRQGKETSYAAIGFDPSIIFAGLDFNLGNLDLTKVYTPNDFEIIEFE